MSYHHFSTVERGRIEELYHLGYSCRSIGVRLGRSHTSISRELKRNGAQGSYQGALAQEKYEMRRQKSYWSGKYTAELGEVIYCKLEETWSPEQIAHTITLGKASTKTIYNWLYQGKLGPINMQLLRHKGKRRKKEKRGTFTKGFSISDRPKEVEAREEFGHWELDTMVSSRGKSKGCLSTFVERKSRLYTAFKMEDRSAQCMEKSIKDFFHTLPEGAFKTATTDRGKEFACYDNLAADLNLPLYFADPYAPWQRGSNENGNGLLREFFPKKTNLATIEQKELTKNLFLINNRPRKCLNWKTPIQVFLQQLVHFT